MICGEFWSLDLIQSDRGPNYLLQALSNAKLLRTFAGNALDQHSGITLGSSLKE